ncbi:hypothetical protein D3C84_1089340 [compost metagenome]
MPRVSSAASDNASIFCLAESRAERSPDRVALSRLPMLDSASSALAMRSTLGASAACSCSVNSLTR